MRVLAVLLAYSIAALIAVILTMLTGALLNGISGSTSIGEILVAAMFLFLLAAIYAIPIALPVIVVTEVFKRSDWRIFALAGAVLGLVLTVFFAPVPLEWANLLQSAPLLPITTLSAIGYWAVAWKWLGPCDSNSSPETIAS